MVLGNFGTLGIGGANNSEEYTKLAMSALESDKAIQAPLELAKWQSIGNAAIAGVKAAKHEMYLNDMIKLASTETSQVLNETLSPSQQKLKQIDAEHQSLLDMSKRAALEGDTALAKTLGDSAEKLMNLGVHTAALYAKQAEDTIKLGLMPAVAVAIKENDPSKAQAFLQHLDFEFAGTNMGQTLLSSGQFNTIEGLKEFQRTGMVKPTSEAQQLQEDKMRGQNLAAELLAEGKDVNTIAKTVSGVGLPVPDKVMEMQRDQSKIVNKFLVNPVGDIDSHVAGYKDNLKQAQAAARAVVTVNSDMPGMLAFVQRQMARLSGEVGVLTDKDVKVWGNIQSFQAKANQIVELAKTGKLSDENYYWLGQIVNTLDNMQAKQLNDKLDQAEEAYKAEFADQPGIYTNKIQPQLDTQRKFIEQATQAQVEPRKTLAYLEEVGRITNQPLTKQQREKAIKLGYK